MTVARMTQPLAPNSKSRLEYIDEPQLQFAQGQFAIDPHDGLALYGPYSWQRPEHPQVPPFMVIGPSGGLAPMQQWTAAMNSPCGLSTAAKHRLWPPFPGYEVAFGSPWSPQAAAAFELDRDALLVSSRKKDPHERCFAVVEKYLEAFDKARKQDTKISVALCVVPDEVFANCRPKSRIADPSDTGLSRAQKESRLRGQKDLFDDVDLSQYHFSPDFRRQLKARTMRFDIPLQIVRESTLRLSDENPFGERALTCLSDRMWNLSTALYYKAGGKPWKLNSARDGVCYIGIAFRRSSEGPNTACCAAQMFLDSGDGIVFLGEYGPWYSPERKQFQLDRSAARKLLSGILDTYRQLDGKPLKEIFLHCRSTIGFNDFAGFQDACPDECKLIGIRVRNDSMGPRLFRDGTRPVLRGTFLRENDRSGYLYAAGFKPRLATYDGWETPVPLKIDIQHGEADIRQVASDILGLTKLNYNACKLGDSQPVTVGFSDAVGEILISNPTVQHRRPNFKFYI